MPTADDVRLLGPADVEDYRAIRLAALATTPDAFGSVHAVEAARPIEHHAQRLGSSMVFSAYELGRIVGMVGLRQEDGPKDAHKGFVWGFFVEPAVRSRGIGAALLAALLDVARGIVEQVMLSVVAESNSAIALYGRFGFKSYGVEPRALKMSGRYHDEVMMVMFLDPAALPLPVPIS
ncbi:N-acetyltransferase family protein [Lichenicola sp.]|uniref:GNAT family N-acetyltransferase n=1 Tax=Lichenicola sp. TaxID=2804529 RepID=UPI003AFF8252